MRFPALFAAGLLVAACDGTPTAPDATQLAAARLGAELQPVRAATARFSSFAQAEKAGYDAIFLDACFQDPIEGAMGYHYINGPLIDGTIDALKPEAIMYEPQANGTLKMVGLEYVVDAAQWDASAGAPTLFGETYAYNGQFNIYTLHVWLWQANPKGMFIPWNPAVSCANAPSTLTEHAH